MNKYFLVLLLFCNLVFISCKKEDLNEREFEVICEASSYSDTIFYINDALTNIILPQQNLNGIFSSIPEGLALDSLTGEIDINASETGLKYRVSFTPANSNQSCQLDIVISGVNYLDKIYILDQQEQIAFPVFNGDSSGTSPCPEDDDDDDDDCKFDEDGPDGTDLSDIGIEVSASTGEIDLEQTVANNAFGINPANGSTLDVTLYYRLNDNSLRALNSLDLRLFYFETLTEVPQSLIDEVEEKNNQLLGLSNSNSYLNTRLAQDNLRVKPRPPYLIIVARLQ
ncbi:hypothetical protein Belba_2468 [Belliella baltica DSM 15883]|uniref:Lipoprotein n=1 Tax=Belliella baltica (strain DSM 15883 / CIP 108006 / LMG 21964 / BA134) TaxID=866536 RepID=I3Z706_BELBD|nr:hypothetical protein [Belliella baltica]AFL85024.1 hypothetical protein Belba_2468 [Belliella baltica DSM 15883]